MFYLSIFHSPTSSTQGSSNGVVMFEERPWRHCRRSKSRTASAGSGRVSKMTSKKGCTTFICRDANDDTVLGSNKTVDATRPGRYACGSTFADSRVSLEWCASILNSRINIELKKWYMANSACSADTGAPALLPLQERIGIYVRSVPVALRVGDCSDGKMEMVVSRAGIARIADVGYHFALA